MTEKEKNKLCKQLDEEANLISKSVDFWKDQVDKVLAEMDKLDEGPIKANYEKKSEELIQKLEYLIKKADFEEAAIIALEKKLYKVMGVKNRQEFLAQLQKPVKKRRKSK